MPAEETTNLYQFAVLWQRVGTDPYGQPVVGSPCQINVRWNTVRREAINNQGQTIALDAVADVARKIAVGSHMWLGKLADWYGTGSGVGNPDEELCEVKTYNETLDEKGRDAKRSVGLMRLHNKGAN